MFSITKDDSLSADLITIEQLRDDPKRFWAGLKQFGADELNELFQIHAEAKNVLYAPISIYHMWRSVLSSAALNSEGSGHMRGYLAGSYIDMGAMEQRG